MFKNKAENGWNNIAGHKIRTFRQSMEEKTSQKRFAGLLRVVGIDVDEKAIQRIECGKRFITDIELKAIAKILNVSYEELLGD